jgi:hypothetical protein
MAKRKAVKSIKAENTDPEDFEADVDYMEE